MVTTAPKLPTQPTDTGVPPLILRLSPAVEMDDNQFAHFCSLNPELHIELTAAGELEIMSPTNWQTGRKNSKLTAQLEIWSERDGTGIALDSSTGFTLPNGAKRSPDASWILKSRIAELTPEQSRGLAHICPDFVIELRSDSDRLADLQAKMDEYIANGARLGWLIDPQTRSVHTYRPDHDVEIITNPETISADPTLPGFTLDLTEIWNWNL